MSETIEIVEKKENNKKKYLVIGGALLCGYLIGVKAGKKIAAKEIAKGFKKNWYTLLDDTTGASVPSVRRRISPTLYSSGLRFNL